MSEESMVERVARAIYHGKARNRPWEVLPVEFKRQYHKQARAAMREMRNPDRAQVDAGVAMALQVSIHGQGGWSEYIAGLHRQMIDAALNAP